MTRAYIDRELTTSISYRPAKSELFLANTTRFQNRNPIMGIIFYSSSPKASTKNLFNDRQAVKRPNIRTLCKFNFPYKGLIFKIAPNFG